MRAATFGVSRLFNTISDRADESVPSGAAIKILTPSPSECDCCLEVIKIKQVLQWVLIQQDCPLRRGSEAHRREGCVRTLGRRTLTNHREREVAE